MIPRNLLLSGTFSLDTIKKPMSCMQRRLCLIAGGLWILQLACEFFLRWASEGPWENFGVNSKYRMEFWGLLRVTFYHVSQSQPAQGKIPKLGFLSTLNEIHALLISATCHAKVKLHELSFYPELTYMYICSETQKNSLFK